LSKCILIISPQSWGKMLISKHHYAIELAKMNFTVYFMNPPNRVNNLKGYSIEQINEYPNLYLINYHLPKSRIIDFLRYRCKLTQIYDRYLLQLVKKIVHQQQITLEQIWNFDPNLHGYLAKYPAKKKLFFTADIIEHISQTRAAKNIDAVVAVANELLKKFAATNNKLLLVNHGINQLYQQFATDNLQQLTTTTQATNNKRIQVGYIGNLLISCLYIDGLKKIIEENTDIDFHFWGSYDGTNNNVMGSFNQALALQLKTIKEQHAHAHFYGVKSANEIIPHLNKIDAFIYINDATKDMNGGANSHKILEYLTTGKVVIATYLSYYQPLQLFPMIAKGAEATYPQFFKESIQQLATLNSIAKQKERITFALNNTYQKNIQKILDYIN
jgi:hypothetical protein